MEDRIAFRPKEAMKATGLGRTFLFELMRSGQLESFKVGRARFIPADALQAFMAARRADQQVKQ